MEEVFEAIDIYSFAETNIDGYPQMNMTGGWTWGLDSSIYGVGVDIGNWDIDFYYRKPGTSDYYCWFRHIWYEWWILPADHNLEWFNRAGVSRGTVLSVSDMEDDSEGASEVSYRAVCDHTTYHTSFAYDEEVYSDFETAWHNGDLYIFVGVNFDDQNTAYNAWHLISMLLFFQLPNVHPVVNAILAIPIWIGIIYLTFILILRAIGAIFGGGA